VHVGLKRASSLGEESGTAFSRMTARTLDNHAKHTINVTSYM
jgi:hypothetical protein